MLLLSCRQLKKSFGTKEVLKGLDFDIKDKDRLGIIGDNGAGKSTLAAILSREIEADEGLINTCGKKLSISVFDQQTAELEYQDSGKAGLSGGEKVKTSLAKALARQSDLLILDEPTNNLDSAGITWLIREIRSYQGAVLIISHDRYLLDQVVQRIILLDRGLGKIYEGNYTFFREEKRKEERDLYHQYYVEQKKQQAIKAEINRLQKWSGKAHNQSMRKARETGGKKEYFRGKAKKMDRQIKSKLKMLEKLQHTELEKPKGEQRLRLDFSEATGHGKRIMEAREISKSYGRKVLFEKGSFYVMRGERIGIIGPNGCGKTTLLKCMVGQESLDEGKLWLSSSARWIYFQQDLLSLPLQQTPAQYLAEEREQKDIMPVMSGLGLYGRIMQEPIMNMSYGQQTRLKLAKVLLADYNLLLMDEPTNHLDIVSREHLEEALCQYKGTLVLVSHDHYLVQNVCDRLIVFKDGTLRRLESAEDPTGNRDIAEDNEEKQGEQQKMVLELRLTQVISQLAQLEREDPAYQELEEEFKELSRQKRELF